MTATDRSIRWAKALRRAMDDRQVRNRTLAAACGLDDTSISNMRRGVTFPRPDTVALIADALDWPSLVELSLEIRAKTCPVCGIPFQDATARLNQVYCKSACAQTANLRRIEGRKANAAAIMSGELSEYQKMVRDHCMECTLGEGICRDAGCRLREKSPLPLFARLIQVQPIDDRFGEGRYRGITDYTAIAIRKRAYKAAWMREKRAKEAQG